VSVMAGQTCKIKYRYPGGLATVWRQTETEYFSDFA
jgi:hypothetical protein